MEEFIQKLNDLYSISPEEVKRQNEEAVALLRSYQSLSYLLQIIQNSANYDPKLVTYAQANISRICDHNLFDEDTNYINLFEPIIDIYYTISMRYDILLYLYLKISYFVGIHNTSSIILNRFFESDNIERKYYTVPLMFKLIRIYIHTPNPGTADLFSIDPPQFFEEFGNYTHEYFCQDNVLDNAIINTYSEICFYFSSNVFENIDYSENILFNDCLNLIASVNGEHIINPAVISSIIENFFIEVNVYGIKRPAVLEKIGLCVKESLPNLIQAYYYTEIPFKIIRYILFYSDYFGDVLDLILELCIAASDITENFKDIESNPSYFYSMSYEINEESHYSPRDYVHFLLHKLIGEEQLEDCLDYLYKSIQSEEFDFRIESIFYCVSELYFEFSDNPVMKNRIQSFFERSVNFEQTELYLCSMTHFYSRIITILDDDFVSSFSAIIFSLDAANIQIWYLLAVKFVTEIFKHEKNIPIEPEFIYNLLIHEQFNTCTQIYQLWTQVISHDELRIIVNSFEEQEIDIIQELLNAIMNLITPDKSGNKDDEVDSYDIHFILLLLQEIIKYYGNRFDGVEISKVLLNGVCLSIDYNSKLGKICFCYVLARCQNPEKVFLHLGYILSRHNVYPSDFENDDFKMLTFVFQYLSSNNPELLQCLIQFCRENGIYDFESHMTFENGELTLLEE